jgi:hypothetical protein
MNLISKGHSHSRCEILQSKSCQAVLTSEAPHSLKSSVPTLYRSGAGIILILSLPLNPSSLFLAILRRLRENGFLLAGSFNESGFCCARLGEKKIMHILGYRKTSLRSSNVLCQGQTLLPLRFICSNQFNYSRSTQTSSRTLPSTECVVCPLPVVSSSTKT